MSGRRKFFQDAAFFGAGLLGLSEGLRGEPQVNDSQTARAIEQGRHHSPYAPHKKKEAPPPGPDPYLLMRTPDLADLPFEMDGGVKIFKLIAQPVRRKISPSKTIDAWGYNGSVPGPNIQVQQGERVRILVENRLPEATSIHWHGLEVPIDQDGVPWISQKPIAPGETHTYEFTVHQEGTFFYHSHGAMQEMMGMIGFFVAHPARSYKPHADHDFGLVLQEWAVLPNNQVPNSASMEFNWLTFNGVAAPATTPMIVKLGSRVRIRILNMGMDHHPIHLHGNQFVMTGTEGGRAPDSTWYPMNTILVAVAQARVIEFDAKYPGAWMVHCHLPHHMMNNMTDLLGRRPIETAALTEAQAMSQMPGMSAGMMHEQLPHSPVAPDANRVPGFPQDAFMEMGMDQAVAKPETYGLPVDWSAQMMGMMTLVRVLPEKEYEEMLIRIENAKGAAMKEPAHES
ncbi:MAG TPA: copper oxidase [Candidatus Acidoferrum sp.]|nr:copper oxidase [Candidatus Acidoferrum sp.]